MGNWHIHVIDIHGYVWDLWVPFCFSPTAGVNQSLWSLILLRLANRISHLSPVSTMGSNEFAMVHTTFVSQFFLLQPICFCLTMLLNICRWWLIRRMCYLVVRIHNVSLYHLDLNFRKHHNIFVIVLSTEQEGINIF